MLHQAKEALNHDEKSKKIQVERFFMISRESIQYNVLFKRFLKAQENKQKRWGVYARTHAVF